MTEAPSDAVVNSAIIKTLSQQNECTRIRPNKLRKIICKKVQGTTWTQYQRVLDSLIHSNDNDGGMQDKLQTVVDEKDCETYILPLSKESHSREGSATADKSEQDNNTNKEQKPIYNDGKMNIHRLELQVPLAILSHLVKKGQKKLKSIEQNSKTTFSIPKESISAVKKLQQQLDLDDEERSELCKKEYPITIQPLTLGNNDYSDEDDETMAKKHVNTAKLHIDKMIQSFTKNPERFYPRKPGGTFKEQEEAKKRKIQANKRKKIHQAMSGEGSSGNDEKTITKKKKKRKFY